MNLLRDKSIIINKLSERLNNLCPDPDDKDGLGITRWKGKKIIPSDEWRKIANVGKAFAYGIEYQKTEEALQYFPDDYMPVLFPLGVEEKLQERTNEWYSDYLGLMEYRRNPGYGKNKCVHCLLSPYREEAAIFIGINKVVSHTLDSNSTSVYPCEVLNRFACPYDKKTVGNEEEDITGNSNQNQIKKLDVDYLFYLSELAFAVELALGKAQEEGSVFRIQSASDAYHALTNRETLEMVLQQGLKEEHIQYKDNIVELLTNMKDRIKVEDLTVY